MKRSRSILAIVAVAGVAALTALAQAPPERPPVPTPGPDGFDEAAAVAALKKQIEGKEQLPAKEVFKDIRVLGSVPAARLLGIMQMGYSRSLGVTCTHCHVA